MQHFSPEQVKQTLFSTIDSLAANRLTVSGTVFQLDKTLRKEPKMMQTKKQL